MQASSYSNLISHSWFSHTTMSLCTWSSCLRGLTDIRICSMICCPWTSDCIFSQPETFCLQITICWNSHPCKFTSWPTSSMNLLLITNVYELFLLWTVFTNVSRIESFVLRAKKVSALCLSHNLNLIIFVQIQWCFSNVLVPGFLTLKNYWGA